MDKSSFFPCTNYRRISVSRYSIDEHIIYRYCSARLSSGISPGLDSVIDVMRQGRVVQAWAGERRGFGRGGGRSSAPTDVTVKQWRHRPWWKRDNSKPALLHNECIVSLQQMRHLSLPRDFTSCKYDIFEHNRPALLFVNHIANNLLYTFLFRHEGRIISNKDKK